jgi:type IV pilus assembly protein PilE
MNNRTSFLSSRRSGGFTLVELMIACVVLAIIVGIAVPAYTQQMHKARRVDARNAILDLAGREERYLSVANSYSQNPADLGYGGPNPISVTVNNGYYQLSAVSPDAAQPGVTPSFLITATAIGAQASDADCTTFSVNQLGQQSATGANPATCWRP